MKKKYIQPRAQVEYFTLSQSIAAGCGAFNPEGTLGTPTHGDKNSCGWKTGNFIAWMDDSICDFPTGDEFQGVCYNNPNGGQTIFAS